jgi:hypothetical protein
VNANVGVRRMTMKRAIPILLMGVVLTGCVNPDARFCKSDVVGKWQHHDGGLLSADETFRFQGDGTFSYGSTDTIVGQEMAGKWTLENDRIRLFIAELKVRGKPQAVPTEWSKGILTGPLNHRGERLVLQLEEGRDFERTGYGVDK